MPREKSAYKEIRKAKKRHQRNLAVASELKTIRKNFDRLITEKKFDEAKKLAPLLISKIDKAAGKGTIKKNTASRKIARLMKKIAAGQKK